MRIDLAAAAATWSAVASWVAIVIALGAALVARGQLAEARRLRRERSQPYVIAYVDQNPVMSDMGDLVIENLGQTAAMDVRPVFGTPLRSAVRGQHDNDDHVLVPELISTLVPGQRWRTLWDRTTVRHEAGLPMQHQVEIGFRDTTGRAYPPQAYTLDLQPVALHGQVVEYGLHDIGKSLRDISKTLKQKR